MYIILGILLSANAIANHSSAWLLNRKNSILIEQLLILFQSLLLGFFFLKVLNKSKFERKIKWLLILMICFQFVLLFVVHVANIEIRSNIILSIILLMFCFFYFRNLMKNEPTLILVKSSTFWIVIGIFFSSSIGVPVITLVQFIPKNPEYVNLRSQIFSIFNVSLIVLYLFIIKSYLCLKHPQNS
ncbi:MAG: hypothetical protein ABIN74_06575 [Ferruginibacter sp.]